MANRYFELEDGLELNSRVFCGMEVGHIIEVTRTEYKIKWRDGITTQLRPDLDEDELLQAAE